MKVRKGNIELSIDPKDWKKYKESGWTKKVEIRPEVIRERYEALKKKKGKV